MIVAKGNALHSHLLGFPSPLSSSVSSLRPLSLSVWARLHLHKQNPFIFHKITICPQNSKILKYILNTNLQKAMPKPTSECSSKA